MKSAHERERQSHRSHYVGLAMAGLMTMPIAVIELVVMRSMYDSRRLNIAIIAGCIVTAAVFWFGIRQQAGVTERQFLKSMIPHHASAVPMCQRTEMTDPEALNLCRRIIAGQRAEIEQMKAMLGG